jgi:bacteriocin-like protein
MNTEHELTIDELEAVSGGSLPLPAIVATIVRAIVGPEKPLPTPPGMANGYDSTGPLLPY